MDEKDLKKYLNEIEQLSYSSRLPEHATLFKNKAIMSKMLWDVHFYNSKKFYKESNKTLDQIPSLEKDGYITGELNDKESLLLKEIFSSCEKMPLDPFEFSFDYVYEPRENLHGDMERVNNYFQPSEFFFNRFPELLNPLKALIERENQFYWNDLIGLNVYLDNEEKIGVVADMIETGSNDVLVIKGDDEILIPYIFGESVKNVIIEENKIIIDKIYCEY